jgi:hypothetical protein
LDLEHYKIGAHIVCLPSHQFKAESCQKPTEEMLAAVLGA